MKLDEEHYVENKFLSQLQRLGWKIYRQNKDNPEEAIEILSFNSSLEPLYRESIKFRESFRDVILENILKESLMKTNPWIEEDQINEVIRKITTPLSNSLLEANKEIHDLFLENTSVSENRKTGEKSPTVRLIDFKNIDNNSFIAISQFKVNITGTEKHIIPDIVLFVNGMPLIVVECKSPAIADPISEAILQLMRYSNRRGAIEGNERLFWYNIFNVATSIQVAKYGTITSEYEHFVEWKDPYPYSLSEIGEGNITSQQVLVQGMLSKENLLDILHTYTIFKEDSKGKVVKIVARYQQFRAAKKIIKSLKEGKTPEDRGGIIWHTQGSGKSLTMMFVVRELYHNPELGNYKVVFVTDRKDLEKQLNDTSKSVGFTVRVAGSIHELKEILKTNTPELIMGMVHKFQERELESNFPILNESEKILVMIDEAHRTQYKYLGANLRKSLPNATKIAFTGTPIDKTEMTFGDYIDKYSIRQSVEDGVTVSIVYEGRVHSAELSDEEAANAKFEDVFKDADEDVKRMIMGRFTWRGYLEAEEVIRDKAKDMIEHYITHVFPNGFKAQVVAVSRLAAIKYKEALEKALKEKIDELMKKNSKIDLETLKRLEVGVVISGALNDPPEYKPYIDVNEHERIIKSFRLPFNKEGNVGILVVQSMLITGFDAPIEQVMYLDNVIKGHNLLQAIARVNRAYNNKSCGFVVDYVGVLKHLREALSIYADEDIEEISEVVINKAKSVDALRFYHNSIEEFFNKNGIKNWRQNIEECIDILVDEKVRNEFIDIVRKFNRAMDEVLPDPEGLKYLADLKIISFIKESARNRYRDSKLSVKDASNKVREIIEEYLISKGVDPKIPPTPLLENKFIDNLNKKSSKVKVKELEIAIDEYIDEHFDEDPELYERFSERLKKLLEGYKEKWDELYIELNKMREELKKGRANEDTFGFDPKKEMPFFGILKDKIFGKKSINDLSDKDIDFLVDLTKDVVELIKREMQTVDFWDNPTKQKLLKSYIFSHLLEKISSAASQSNIENIKEDEEVYITSNLDPDIIYSKRNEIAQKLLEVAYHNYRK
ncbi:type I restriction endonuclease subunit R [Aceticella autotrophica]|uniref:Type I restriction enzyme endonuclease subunit n=1 Tax=Aceticella autotrophica TaxID=2755338 RepID=A0A975GAX8_9THEO|nr:type I restriction endonuclease subunit R [Aceticella autotrophica]QSZ27626.1 type I restriction endonuclease subunit R [Aceticella autotrophica]